MQISAPPTPLPKIGELREHRGGVPEHGEFVLARTAPSDGTAGVEFTTQRGTRMWMSPDDDAPRVFAEAQQAAAAAGQAVAIITAEPGHWQQLFVMPLFRTGADGARHAVLAVRELEAAPLARGRHLVGVADASTSIDMHTQPIVDDLLPPRARPGAF